MFPKNTLGLVLAALLVSGVGVAVMGQGTEPTKQEQEKHIKRGPVPYSEPGSGMQMYKDYCASCHGPKGKGDGPAAEYLKNPLPDLTMLAKQNNGKFPADHVATVLRCGTEKHPHGTPDMPIWGQLFRSQDPDLTGLRIQNLTKYLESLQAK